MKGSIEGEQISIARFLPLARLLREARLGDGAGAVMGEISFDCKRVSCDSLGVLAFGRLPRGGASSQSVRPTRTHRLQGLLSSHFL